MTSESSVGLIESGQQLVHCGQRHWSQRELLRAAERAELPNTGWPFGLVDEPTPIPGGVQARIDAYGVGETTDFWSLLESGQYYLWRLYEEDFEQPQFSSSTGHPESSIWFDVRIHRIAEVVLHSAALYRELGVAPDEPYLLAVNHRGIEGRELYYSTVGARVRRGQFCQTPSATWNRQVTQDYVTGGLKELVREIVDELFVLFAFAQIAPQVISHHVDAFLSRHP